MSRPDPALRVGAGAVLISFSPVFVAVAHAGPTAIAFYRMAVGGAILAALTALGRRSVPSRRTIVLAAVSGLLLGTDLVTWHHAIRAIDLASTDKTVTTIAARGPTEVGAEEHRVA